MGFFDKLFGWQQKKNPAMEQHAEELIKMMQHIKNYITDDSVMSWTGFKNAESLRRVIDGFILRIQKRNSKVMKQINFEFLPTSSFCEHATSNGWSQEYNDLADRFDVIYKEIQTNTNG